MDALSLTSEIGVLLTPHGAQELKTVENPLLYDDLFT